MMKTLLFNPIFINPQAYFVFPNLSGSLVQETEVSIEPAIFAGTVEVKVIANGDTSLVKYYSNTNTGRRRDSAGTGLSLSYLRR